MKIAATLLIMGALLFGYGLTLPAHTDEGLFIEKLSHIEDKLDNGRYEDDREKAVVEFCTLRDEMGTSKYQFIDYGITLIMTAFILPLIARKGKFRVRLIGSRIGLATFAIAVSILTVVAPIFGIYLDEVRLQFPPWEDSYLRGIPLAPIGTVPFLMWSFLHIALFSEPNQPAIYITYSMISTANWWLLFISAVTMGISALFAVYGGYWLAMPGFLWVYFYLSLAASRRQVKTEQG